MTTNDNPHFTEINSNTVGFKHLTIELDEANGLTKLEFIDGHTTLTLNWEELAVFGGLILGAAQYMEDPDTREGDDDTEDN